MKKKYDKQSVREKESFCGCSWQEQPSAFGFVGGLSDNRKIFHEKRNQNMSREENDEKKRERSKERWRRNKRIW